MGLHSSKHIDISKIPETASSKEFKLKRKLHYKNEFGAAKINLELVEQDPNPDDRNLLHPVGPKRPTFLEPPSLHNELEKELFRKTSIRSEINEFTYAKERLHRRKIKSHIDKSLNMEDRKKKKRRRKKSVKRNRSHEPPEAKGN